MTSVRPLLAVVLLVASATTLAAQGNVDYSQVQIKATKIGDNFYALEGSGGMIGVQAGPDGVFMVDSGLEQNAEAPLAALAALQKDVDAKRAAVERFAAEGNFSTLLEPYYRSGPPKPVRYIVNTTFAPDHIGGNLKIRSAGRTFTGGNVAHYSPEQPRVLIDGDPRRAPWIDLGDLRARGAIVVWTDGDSDPRVLPLNFRNIAGDAEIQEPLALPYRRGKGEAVFGWALLRPRPSVALK